MNKIYFESQEGLTKLLEEYQDIFDMIDDFGQQLVQGIPNTPNDYKEILNKLTGAFISLEPLYTQAEAKKLNEELQAYVSMKRELESKGEKVVAASLEKESSLAVAEFRRIRAILEGYVEACAKAIGTCQTQLKSLELEYKNRNTQINE
jgi:dimeric dUTPase (all-alpha-NTP-PPase superfamily)